MFNVLRNQPVLQGSGFVRKYIKEILVQWDPMVLTIDLYIIVQVITVPRNQLTALVPLNSTSSVIVHPGTKPVYAS